MRKILLFSFMAYISYSYSQEKVLFDMHYKPNTKYTIEVNQQQKVKTIHSGSESYMSYFREANIDSIIESTEKIKTKGILRVFKKNNGVSPVEMEFILFEKNGRVEDIFSGITFFGNVEERSLPKIDSLDGNYFPANFKKEIVNMISNVFEQIKFPKIEMVIGEHHIDTTPFSIPIADNIIEMNITTKYTLVGKQNNSAFFNIDQSGDVSLVIDGNNFEGIFSAKGESEYDLHNNMLVNYDMDGLMEVEFLSDYYNQKVISNFTIDQNVIIESL